MGNNSLPRQSLLLLTAALLSSLVLHVSYLPSWFYAAALFVLGWRILVYLGYLSFPGRIAKTVTVLLASYGVFVTAGGAISLEASGAFLASAGLLKLLEMSNRRDAVFVVFIAFFLQASGFLFDQSIVSAALGIVTMLLATAAMISAQSANREGLHADLSVFKTAGRLILFSIPFMLIVYFLFPRIGPLWSVALNSESSMTGLSSQMRPGDISSLSQSSKVAFRVTFDGEKPAQRDLYWRAMTFDFHDGDGWEQSGLDKKAISMPEKTSKHRYQYEVIQEATGQQFLFTLSEPVLLTKNASTNDDINFSYTRGLFNQLPLYERIRYRVASIGENTVPAGLSTQGNNAPVIFSDNNPRLFQNDLHLPSGVNEKTIEWAKTLPKNSVEFTRAFTTYIATQPFYYTLKPPRYGDNDIDKFLFEGRRGFCEHYASAMTFAARAAGIPARIVAGYQGGEWHDEGYLTVRQYDAHAWVELWNGNAWQRVDPTAAVAPMRIEYGLERAIENEGTFLSNNLLSPHRYRSIGWINSLRQEMDNINYLWSRWVLSYDGAKQSDLLSRWFGMDDFIDGLYILAGTIAGLFLLGTGWQMWLQRPQKKSRLVLSWKALMEQSQQAGLVMDAGTPPLSLLKQIAEYFVLNSPELSKECEKASELFIKAQYGDSPDLSADLLLARQLSLLARRIRKINRSHRRPSTKTSTASDI